MNLYSVNFDPTVFEDPEKFNPHRFLNKKGEYEPRHADHVLAFGYGKRKCVGKFDSIRKLHYAFYHNLQLKSIKVCIFFLKDKVIFLAKNFFCSSRIW